jgi:tetratricopeptide (TPR) repeat protein
VLATDKQKTLIAAQKLILKGDYKKAAKEYQKLIEASPKDTRLYLKVGDLYLKQGDSEKAVKEYFRAAKIEEDDDLNQKAISIYKIVLSIDPKNTEASHRIAKLYLKEGLIGSAKGCYQGILRIRPDDQEAKSALQHLENPEQPREESMFAPIIEPASPKSRPLPETRKTEESLDRSPTPPIDLPGVSQDIEVSSVDKESETHYHLGIAYQEMELFDYAISEFETALTSQSLKFDCYIMLGACYMQKGQYEKSIDHYKTASQIEGLSEEKLARLHFNLGLAYEAHGMMPAAMEAFTLALKFDPSLSEAQEKVKKLPKSH